MTLGIREEFGVGGRGLIWGDDGSSLMRSGVGGVVPASNAVMYVPVPIVAARRAFLELYRAEWH